VSQESKELLLRGEDQAHGRRSERFDPVAEGRKRGLPHELSVALWKQACREAIDTSGRIDAGRAKRAFYDLVERLVAREGRLQADVGRTTRVETEIDHAQPNAPSIHPLAPQIPGRDTRVLVEARALARTELASGGSAEAAQGAASEPPGTPSVSGMVAPLQQSVRMLQRVFLAPSQSGRLGSLFGMDLSRVPIVLNSPAATGSTKAVTKDGAIHFRIGAYQPGTSDGDWLIAHELAHVVQQRAGRGPQTGTTREIEREADRAASLAMQGRAAPLRLRAEPGVAYAFDEGEPHDDGTAIEREPPHRADAHAAGATEPATPESAHASHDEAAAHEPAELDTTHEGLADVAAVLPAEGAPGAAPAGGGGPAAKPSKPAPNVATAKPEQGLALLHGVRPDLMSQLFGQVRSTSGAEVAKTRATQRANPPKQMSTGAATAAAAGKLKEGAGAAPSAANATAADPNAAHTAKANDKAAQPVKPDAPDAQAAKQAMQAAQDDATAQRAAVTQVVASTKRQIASWFSTSFDRGDAAKGQADGKMSDQETRQLSGSIDKIPTTASDVSTDTGPAPELAMKQEAQGSAARERAELEKTVAAHQTLSRADSRAPMGEDHIEPGAAPEELTATPPVAGQAGAPAGRALPTVAGAASSEEAGIVAQEQSGAEIDAALTKASTDVTAERGKHEADEAKARADSDKQIRELKTKADADQEAARASAHADVTAARGEWQAQIDQQGADARKQGDKKVAEGMQQVAAEEAKANAEAKKHVEEGHQKADEEKKKGEKEAADAKDKGKEKSSGVWGWVKSKAKAAVDGIKKAVSSAIDACRRAVKAVIAAAKKLAMAVIEAARKVITSVIKAVGKALLAISDVLLAAFPGLKAKFQAAIKKAVDKAVGVVNKLADALKKGVQKALDALGAALDKALQLLEKGINAIIDAATSIVEAAVKAAQAIVTALGTWAKLIKDVASGPGAWIKNLGAAVVDGIKNHLWTAFKSAVVDWFKSKVFELLGVGGIILELLLEGGLTREHIIQMALDALMVAIPAALVAILIEKIVSMIVPAAGAVMAIIEGLQAAWGTISRIIAAFSAFVGFLLAVKSGSAGPLFAGLLAAAAVIVLDFVSNWLLKKIAGAARKVGAKLKGLAEKFKLKRKAKRDAKAAKHHDEHDAGKNKDGEHNKGDKAQKEEKEKKNQETLAKAERELPPKIQAALQKRPYKGTFRARLLAWRVQYKLTSLKMVPSGNQFKIEATVNPKTQLAGGYEYEDAELLAMLKRVGDRLLRDNPEAIARAGKRAGDLGIDPTKAKAQRAYAPESAEERLAIAAHQKQEQPGREPRDRTLVHHGEVEDGSHIRSVHEKPGGSGKRKQGDELVRSVNDNESASNAKRYKDLAKTLEDRGIGPQQLGAALRLMSRGVAVPSHLKGSEKELGEIMGLFFGTEPSRDSRNAVHSMMAIEQLERGGQGTTIAGTFDKLPAEMKGHVKATDTLDADLAGQDRPDTKSRPQQERDVTELKNRQLAQLQAWFQTQIAGGRTPLSTSIEDLETFVEDMVRRFIRSYKR
jgi:Domain of unknown function (DUF4157)